MFILTLATIAPLLFLTYQLIIDWVDLFPWNDVSRKTSRLKIQEVLINYSPLLLIACAFWRPTPQSVFWGMFGSILYLIGHVRAWWVPYFFGTSEKEYAEYKLYFGRTFKFLPPIKQHPIPDAEHTMLGIICLGMTVISVLAYFEFT